FSTVFGEYIFESISLNSNVANLRSTQSLIKYSIVLIVCGLLVPFIDIVPVVGAENFDPLKYPFLEAVPILNAHTILYIPGLPLFLLKGTPSNLFFLMGLALLITAIFYCYSDVLNHEYILCNILNIFGNHSITSFFLQFLFIALLYQKITILWFFPFIILYLTLFGVFFFLWKKHGNSILSLDWIMDKISGKDKVLN
ncbi:MAG: hypothetical protein ACFE96_03465, partial [Candidatus Hermodarchaeota archaeon]